MFTRALSRIPIEKAQLAVARLSASFYDIMSSSCRWQQCTPLKLPSDMPSDAVLSWGSGGVNKAACVEATPPLSHCRRSPLHAASHLSQNAPTPTATRTALCSLSNCYVVLLCRIQTRRKRRARRRSAQRAPGGRPHAASATASRRTAVARTSWRRRPSNSARTPSTTAASSTRRAIRAAGAARFPSSGKTSRSARTRRARTRD